MLLNDASFPFLSSFAFLPSFIHSFTLFCFFLLLFFNVFHVSLPFLILSLPLFFSLCISISLFFLFVLSPLLCLSHVLITLPQPYLSLSPSFLLSFSLSLFLSLFSSFSLFVSLFLSVYLSQCSFYLFFSHLLCLKNGDKG